MELGFCPTCQTGEGGGGSRTADLNSYHRDLQSGRAQRALQTSFLRYSWCIVLIQQGRWTWQRSSCFSEPFTNRDHPNIKKINNKIKEERIKCPRDGRPPRPPEPSAAPSAPLNPRGGAVTGEIQHSSFFFFNSKKVETGHYLHWLSHAAPKLNCREIEDASTRPLERAHCPLSLSYTRALTSNIRSHFDSSFPSPQQLLESNINQNIQALKLPSSTGPVLHSSPLWLAPSSTAVPTNLDNLGIKNKI